MTRHPRPRKDHQRKPGNIQAGKSFLIMTEGEKTETLYFKQLKNRLRLSSVEVDIQHPKCTDPQNLVKAALTLRDTRRCEAKRGSTVPFDEVWVVFDLEGNNSVRKKQAQVTRSSKGSILLAESDPSFEYWYLLHEEYTTKQFRDVDDLINSLKKYCSQYKKNECPMDLAKTPQAVKNAQKVREYHEKNGGKYPFTDVDLLVCALNESTRPHFRLPL